MFENSCGAVKNLRKLATVSVCNLKDKEEGEQALEKARCQLETCKVSFQRETAAFQAQVWYGT